MAKPNPLESMDFLLANISHLHYTRAHQLLEGIGLYRGQPPLLGALWEHEGFTQTELAERLRIRPATLTRMLQRMERAGFIQRKTDHLDQRITRVYLTEAGRTVQAQVEGVWKKMEEETFGQFSPDECAMLRDFLLRMRENLLRATGEEPWI
jgi:DNA-binding MarR family transcriptional regulator